MDQYGIKESSFAQKVLVNLGELLLILVAYVILFSGESSRLLPWDVITEPMYPARRVVLILFSLIVFVRMGFMMFFLLKRKLGWAEVFAVLTAYAVYYVGFSLLVMTVDKPLGLIDYFAIVVFLSGSFINTYSEVQRHLWKQKPENKGRLYTQGLFKYSMHINFFGDLLWVTAYAVVTRNVYAVVIPVALFCLFVFYNIPALDAYLARKYSKDFEEYAGRTSRFIPFVY